MRSKQAVAEKLHQYTGLPVAYLLKANLRVIGGMFEHELQGDGDVTTGRLDTRFSGPSLDPMSKASEYDPQSSAISSAYVAAFNDYVRRQLKFGDGQHLSPVRRHRPLGFRAQGTGQHGESLQQSTNVMPDLATAMKTNPNLQRVLERRLLRPGHALLRGRLRNASPADSGQSAEEHFSYAWYPSGHMVYAHEPIR